MPTHTEVASQLLNDAATFFKNIAAENKDVEKDMLENAAVFENLSNILVIDPDGVTGGQRNAAMAARLLSDSAKFFRSLANDNPPIAEQMNENARVFEEVSSLVEDDPHGVIE